MKSQLTILDAPVYYPLAFILESNRPGMAFYEDVCKTIANAREDAKRKGLSENCILIGIEPHSGQYIYELLTEEPGISFLCRVCELMAVFCLFRSGQEAAVAAYPENSKVITRASKKPEKWLSKLIDDFNTYL